MRARVEESGQTQRALSFSSGASGSLLVAPVSATAANIATESALVALPPIRPRASEPVSGSEVDDLQDQSEH